MFDIGWSELLVIGVVALVVVGPKDLPEMFRTLGRVTAKARNMAREFQRAMEAAADDSGLRDTLKDVGDIATPRSKGLEVVKQAADRFEKWDPMKPRAPSATQSPGAAEAQAAQGPGAAAVTAPPPSDHRKSDE